MSTDRLKFESQISSVQAAEYLETLAAGLRDGEVSLESGSDAIRLRVADGVSFACSAKASPEKGKSAVGFSVSWRAANQNGHGEHQHDPVFHVRSGSVQESATLAEDDIHPLDLGDVAGGRGGPTMIGVKRAVGKDRVAIARAEASPDAAHPRETPMRIRRIKSHPSRAPKTVAASKPQRAKGKAASGGAGKATARSGRR